MDTTHDAVRVWDLPTRLFHWALVGCIIGSVTTSQIGGNAMIWHFRFGFAVATLLLFRLVWGFVGGRWSRFASFIYGPQAVLRYLRGQARPEDTTGHNPLGAASVFAMLVFLVAQVSTGVFSDDEIAYVGPFAKFVSNATVSTLTTYHRGIGKTVLLVLIVLHLAAIAYYYFRKSENLVRPMVSGDKHIAASVPASRDDLATRVAALVVLLACAALVTWGVSLGS